MMYPGQLKRKMRIPRRFRLKHGYAILTEAQVRALEGRFQDIRKGTGPAQRGAFFRGVRDRMVLIGTTEMTRCPYDEYATCRGGATWGRGFAEWWRRGVEAADGLYARAEIKSVAEAAEAEPLSPDELATLEIACPLCHAGPKELCHVRGGSEIISRPHRVRVRRARG